MWSCGLSRWLRPEIFGKGLWIESVASGELGEFMPGERRPRSEHFLTRHCRSFIPRCGFDANRPQASSCLRAGFPVCRTTYREPVSDRNIPPSSGVVVEASPGTSPEAAKRPGRNQQGTVLDRWQFDSGSQDCDHPSNLAIQTSVNARDRQFVSYRVAELLSCSIDHRPRASGNGHRWTSISPAVHEYGRASPAPRRLQLLPVKSRNTHRPELPGLSGKPVTAVH